MSEEEEDARRGAAPANATTDVRGAVPESPSTFVPGPAVTLTEADYAALFDLAPEHTLRLVREGRERRGATRHETRWLVERDARARPVARYRTWTNRTTEPPYRIQFGWERYSPGGRLLDREVRYSTRASTRALH